MNFIKKVFEGSVDEAAHLQFQKFGKGEFKDRALIKAKYSGGKYAITTSAEFANELVRLAAEKLGNNKTKFTGVVVSTDDLTGKLDFEKKKQFMGVKQYVIDKEISGLEILNLLKEFPKVFFALSFEVGDNHLKVKPKAPKSGKPGSKGEGGPKADFCRLVTSDKEIASDFIFENPDFKEAEIRHTFLIEDLIKPKGETDFAKIRELAKKKGKIIRESVIDGVKTRVEKEFIA